MIYERELTEQIILSAIEVHRILGPGLLESAFKECLCCELENRKLLFERQKGVPHQIQRKTFKLPISIRSVD